MVSEYNQHLFRGDDGFLRTTVSESMKTNLDYYFFVQPEV